MKLMKHVLRALYSALSRAVCIVLHTVLCISVHCTVQHMYIALNSTLTELCITPCIELCIVPCNELCIILHHRRSAEVRGFETSSSFNDRNLNARWFIEASFVFINAIVRRLVETGRSPRHSQGDALARRAPCRVEMSSPEGGSATQERSEDFAEAGSEAVAEDAVDERIDTAVDEASQLRAEHREEEVGATQEAHFLHLTNEGNEIERSP